MLNELFEIKSINNDSKVVLLYWKILEYDDDILKNIKLKIKNNKSKILTEIFKTIDYLENKLHF